MTDQDYLQLIIEIALKHGYDPNNDRTVPWYYDSHMATESAITFHFKGPGLMRCARYLSINDLLYGDNLSLLRAACGEETVKDNVVDKMIEPGNPQSRYFQTTIDKYLWVAQQSVCLAYNKRLGLIVKHLRKDKA